MKSKVTQYILIGCVIIVWGVILFRVISALGEKEPSDAKVQSVIKVESMPVDDSFSINADYPDPFIAGDSDIVGDSVVVRKVNVEGMHDDGKENEKILLESWAYHGLVSNKLKKIRLGLVSVSGKDFLVKEKDVIAGFRVRKVETERLILTKNGKYYVLFLK